MKLLKQYERFAELYRSNYAFYPEEQMFLTVSAADFIWPKGYEDWNLEVLDLNAYCAGRLEQLGISDEENTVELIGGPGLGPNERVPQKVFLTNKRGDIEILQYGLNRRPYTEAEGKRERYVYQTRLHPWHAAIVEGKYDFSKGKNSPFWHKSLIEAYEAGTEIETLVMTEGQIKAFKGCIDGIPTVGLTSINHFKSNGKIHAEIIDFMRRCQVKRLIILWDGDCRKIHSGAIEHHEDTAKRSQLFYGCARKIRELVQDFFQSRVEIYFATVNSDQLRGEPKGLDDLLIEFYAQAQEVKTDFENVGIRPGKFIEWINITADSGIKKMRAFFLLHSVQDFFQYHGERIGSKSFIYQGTTYKIEKGMAIVEMPAEVKQFKLIGTDYYKLKMTPVPNGLEGETVLEEQLTPWKKQTIVDRYGSDVIRKIETYEGFVNIASHIDYQPFIHNHWNLYHNVKHPEAEGEFPHVTILLKHCFQEHYDNEMILDYLTVLYRKPMQKLPIIVLASKDQDTGKSTFMYLLKLIFKQNMSIISNTDLTSDFNSHWTSKLIVGCEETLMEKKDGLEKLKSLSTAKTVQRNEKNKAQTEIACMLHIVLATNHPDDFIRLDDKDSRFWIRIVPPTTQVIKGFDQLLESEIASFVNFISNREIKYNYLGKRLFFDPKDFKTAAKEHLIRQSEPTPIKELRERLEDSFLKWGGEDRRMDVGDIQLHFGIRGERNYLNKIIKNVLNVERMKDRKGNDTVGSYWFPVDNPADHTQAAIIKRKGRPFIFPVAMFLEGQQLDQRPPVQLEIPVDAEDHTVENNDDDLPF